MSDIRWLGEDDCHHDGGGRRKGGEPEPAGVAAHGAARLRDRSGAGGRETSVGEPGCDNRGRVSAPRRALRVVTSGGRGAVVGAGRGRRRCLVRGPARHVPEHPRRGRAARCGAAMRAVGVVARSAGLPPAARASGRTTCAWRCSCSSWCRPTCRRSSSAPTRSPGSRDEVMINSNWGLGESIVGGIATPDMFVVQKQTDGCLVARRRAQGPHDGDDGRRHDGDATFRSRCKSALQPDR